MNNLNKNTVNSDRTTWLDEIYGYTKTIENYEKDILPSEIGEILDDIYEDGEMEATETHKGIANDTFTVKVLKTINHIIMLTCLPVLVAGLMLCDKNIVFYTISDQTLGYFFLFILACLFSYGISILSYIVAAAAYLPGKSWDDEIDMLSDFENEKDMLQYILSGAESNLFMTGLYLLLSKFMPIFSIFAYASVIIFLFDTVLTEGSNSMDLLDYFILNNHSVFDFSEWTNYNFEGVYNVIEDDAVILKIVYHIFYFIKLLIYSGFILCVWDLFINISSSIGGIFI